LKARARIIPSHCTARLLLAAAALFFFAVLPAQERDSLKREPPPYDRKEEIIHYGKRYRIHNNYVTLGGGFAGSSIRLNSQKAVAADFNFHIRRQYFQVGGFMSGDAFLSNNHLQGHLGYGYRREGKQSNLAAYAGPCYFSGVHGTYPAPPAYYSGFGVYLSAQAITKFMYDIGIGIEGFAELSYRQSIFGIKIIAFLSGAYRGEKKAFNPNVRKENPR
jgi:hypothetical protein